MGEQPQGRGDNPLEQFAAKMSESLTGKPLEVNESSVDRLDGGQVRMHQSSARTVRASALQVEESAIGVVRAGSMETRNSAVGVVIAHEASMIEGATSVVVAQHLDADHVQAAFVAAVQVNGTVKAFFTPLTAFAAGAGFATTLWVLRRLAARLLTRTRTGSGEAA